MAAEVGLVCLILAEW